jgi:hypothetical protein
MSRKLIFAARLALVFFCHLDAAAADARKALKEVRDFSLLTAYIEQQFALTPLEVIAKACLDLNVRNQTVHAIFDNYNQFLALFDDPEKRGELARARTHEDLRNSGVWNEGSRREQAIP